MKPDWTLIANATRARLLQQERGSPMVILESFIHPASRSKAGAPDRAARSSAAATAAGSGRAEHTEFARELGHLLEQEAQLDHFRSLAVFASSSFLEELEEQIGKATRRLLIAFHEADLTSFTLSELEERIANEMSPVSVR